jgi:hypothetical protein
LKRLCGDDGLVEMIGDEILVLILKVKLEMVVNGDGYGWKW